MLTFYNDFESSQLTEEERDLAADGCVCHNDTSMLALRGIAVMEDEGMRADHTAGFASTDGKWHHIAVTWSSASGDTKLYDNGRLAWQVPHPVSRDMQSRMRRLFPQAGSCAKCG